MATQVRFASLTFTSRCSAGGLQMHRYRGATDALDRAHDEVCGAVAADPSSAARGASCSGLRVFPRAINTTPRGQRTRHRPAIVQPAIKRLKCAPGSERPLALNVVANAQFQILLP
jgi:hypothetical protein